jgi:hypothetical protein
MLPEAVLQTLRHTWSTLTTLGVEPAVMGGVALAAWRHIRATKDVDLLIGLDNMPLDRLLPALLATGIRPKRDPPVLQLGKLRIIQLMYEPSDAFIELQIDLMLADCEYQVLALSRRVNVQLPGTDLHIAVLTFEDLIIHKLLAGRVIDRADAAALLRINRDTLDLTHLTTWIARLSLHSEFAEVWDEAYPGEVPPSGEAT